MINTSDVSRSVNFSFFLFSNKQIWITFRRNYRICDNKVACSIGMHGNEKVRVRYADLR